jgi:riboflavin synthase
VFTGIVEEVGTIVVAEPLEGGIAFRVAALATLDGLQLGESVAIDGACHTVTAIHSDSFAVQSVATTLQRTTLGGYGVGHRVNLERALALGERIGGHLVQGHVDAVGQVLGIERRGEHVLVDFTLPPIVEEVSILFGSITVNGVSLTINALPGPGQAQVSVIPHTWEITAIRDLKVGSEINLEGDLIGKYVRRLMERPATANTTSTAFEHLSPGRG